MGHLFLIRHGKSEWNKLGKWTGFTDVDLVAEGKEEARRAAQGLKDVDIHLVHTSDLRRAKQTFEEIQHELALHHLTPVESAALKERSYGIYTGKIKEEVRAEVGDEEYKKIRRGWDHPIPEGESLKEVHERIVPYFKEHIFPQLCAGKNVLVVAHGNSLRALVKHLENISDEAICDLNIDTGETYCYTCNEQGEVTEKKIIKA